MSVFDCCHDRRLLITTFVDNWRLTSCCKKPTCVDFPSFPIPIESAVLHPQYPNSVFCVQVIDHPITQSGKSHTTLNQDTTLPSKAYIVEPSNRRTTGIMQHLPVELLERICSFLCFHCQAPCYFPNADMKDVVSDKASLARFCRVSKSICAVAQPFVFHYYAAGNLTSYYRDLPTRPGYLYSGEPELWSHSSDLLPFVLRSIILRPGLARCVRSLQLITLHHYVEEAFTWEDGPEGDIAPAIRKASTDLGLIAYNVFHPEYMGWVRENLDPEDRPRITIGYVHHTLEQLAILLCPRVSTLLLLADFSPPTGNLLASHGTALTTIALVSHDSRGHYAHAGPILALAPNLHTLHAIDARNHDARARPAPDRLAGVAPFSTSTTTTDSDPRPPPPPLVFPALQKAALHDLGLAALAEFVRNAPALRELRYTETWTEDDGRDPEYYWGLAGCLEPARETLRRLVLRVPVSPRLGAQATSGLGSGLGSSGAVVGLLRGLVRLEVLSVSQEAVYGCGAVGGMVRPLRGGAGWVSAAVACGVVYFAGLSGF
ncbi:predicted protein [Chaetomium globosum CBS 148.51]|uniref:Uncharacterized protein n=1 Tax=Chaetomium globosum (strain ATCC 6205 / CBS 148.51 / DSM 1962 / NBRC 6347 / NRRL 1970) TaxID=306901 RepID=Q2HCI3_CHAGB|nr:uncharacterized protein CHGG_02071 [Chaetomium globosum CBS 148.51]EAQ93836.1 predicted protein [Chaetomium globosum CBS 148.51]